LENPRPPAVRLGRQIAFAIRAYSGVRPAHLRDAYYLGTAYLRALVGRIRAPERFVTAGQFLVAPREVVVRVGGLTYTLRPGTEDLGYVFPGHKHAVHGWFDPRPGEVVIDVGAHLGSYSLEAARVGAVVVSIEADPRTFAQLTANIRVNHLEGRIRALHLAAGNAEGETTIYAMAGPFTGISSLDPTWLTRHGAAAPAPVTVPMRRLDTILEDLRLPQVDWLLIDVEGSEEHVLEGASDTLRQTRMLIIEVAKGPGHARCRELLTTRYGFDLVQEFPQGVSTDYWLLRKRPSHPAGAGPGPVRTVRQRRAAPVM
jgi:FkbM family methyltransferase